MERREAIKAVTVGIAGLAGCVSSVTPFWSQTSIPSYVRVQFEILNDRSPSEDEIPAVGEPARVKFQQSGGRVVIVGSQLVGSRNCSKAGIKSFRYDEAERVLKVSIGSKDKSSQAEACESNESVDSYKLVINFDKKYPKEVRVKEGNGKNKNTTTARR